MEAFSIFFFEAISSVWGSLNPLLKLWTFDDRVDFGIIGEAE